MSHFWDQVLEMIKKMESKSTKVTKLLKGNRVDLDNNRFPILQGEVEQISLMKPKAQGPHDEGFLEYLTKYLLKTQTAQRARAKHGSPLVLISFLYVVILILIFRVIWYTTHHHHQHPQTTKFAINVPPQHHDSYLLPEIHHHPPLLTAPHPPNTTTSYLLLEKENTTN